MGSALSLRVLVVDNDEAICAAITEMLESLGYRVDGETESLAALRVFSDDPQGFDLAIIKPVMPEITGLDLAIRFRRIRPGFPVLFYAGYVDDSLSKRIEAESLGQITYKPLIPSELAAAIKERVLPDADAARATGKKAFFHEAIDERGDRF